MQAYLIVVRCLVLVSLELHHVFWEDAINSLGAIPAEPPSKGTALNIDNLVFDVQGNSAVS